MTLRPSTLALTTLLASLAACSNDQPSSTTPQKDALPASRPFSEQEVLAGYPGKVEAGMRVILDLEPATSTPAAGTDTGPAGVDLVPLHIGTPGPFRLCFLGVVPHGLALLGADGGVIATVTAAPSQTCQGSLLSLAAGDYVLQVTHATSDAVTYPLLLSITKGAGATATATAATASEESISLETVPAYDPAKTYSTQYTPVSFNGVIYENVWWANPYDCPVKGPSPQCKVTDGQWIVYDPAVKPEKSYYDYEALRASYPNPPACAKADYGIAAMRARVNASMIGGDMALAAPDTTTATFVYAPAALAVPDTTTRPYYGAADREALYREYMLPCLPPDLSKVADADLPDNVRTVKSVMPLETWKKFASHIGETEPLLPKAVGFTDVTVAYSHFLSAVARYPYFCGEAGGRTVGSTQNVGAFPSVGEACKREVSALFAHAAQETGGGSPYTSFEYLREGGSMGNKNYQPGGVDIACPVPFDCSNAWSLYYGRGPKQVTHFYNYAGFSAARFVNTTSDIDGSTRYGFNYLLEWPDLVAYDPELYFLSGIWFVMTNQPPKPSMHDVILHRYAPATTCTEATCAGLAYDPSLGLAHPFTGTIELINGGIECRAGNDNVAPTHRSDAYKATLVTLGASLTSEEQALPAGCASIIANPPKPDTAFALPNLKAGLHTWLDLSGSGCKAQDFGGAATVSVTANGIVAACKAKK